MIHFQVKNCRSPFCVDFIYSPVLYFNKCNNSGKDYNIIYELTFAGTRESPQLELTKQSAKIDSAQLLQNTHY